MFWSQGWFASWRTRFGSFWWFPRLGASGRVSRFASTWRSVIRRTGAYVSPTWSPRAVPSALRLALHTWGVALNLRAATLATHRMQKTGVYLSERHARITSYPLHSSDSNTDSIEVTYRGVVRHERRMEAFATGQAAVGYFRDDRLGISVFGFALDREFLRTFHLVSVGGAGAVRGDQGPHRSTLRLRT